MSEEKAEENVATNVIHGADSPRESDKGEGGVDVEGKLGSVAACSREQGNEAVNTSDLVEHLMATKYQRWGRGGRVAESAPQKERRG